MKRVGNMILCVALTALLGGCAIAPEASTGEDYKNWFIVPVADSGFVSKTLQSDSLTQEIPVNLTKEQADDLFGHVSLWGNTIALPLRVSDLPKTCTVTYSEQHENFFYTDMYFSGRLLYTVPETGEKFEVVVNMIQAPNEEDPIIIGMETDVLTETSNIRFDMLEIGKSIDAFTEKYGEGTEVTAEVFKKGKKIVYSDGTRMLSILFSTYEEGKENVPFFIDYTSYPTYDGIVCR